MLKYTEVWLSLVEYFVRDEGAAGSNPVTSTTKTSVTKRFLRFLLCLKKCKKWRLTAFFIFNCGTKSFSLFTPYQNLIHPKAVAWIFCPCHLCYYAFLSFAFCSAISAFISFISMASLSSHSSLVGAYMFLAILLP